MPSRPLKIKEIRKSIARILTVMNAKPVPVQAKESKHKVKEGKKPFSKIPEKVQVKNAHESNGRPKEKQKK